MFFCSDFDFEFEFEFDSQEKDVSMNANDAGCLRFVEQHVEQRMEWKMERNRVLCAEMEPLREKKRARERRPSDAPYFGGADCHQRESFHFGAASPSYNVRYTSETFSLLSLPANQVCKAFLKRFCSVSNVMKCFCCFYMCF